MPFSYSGNPKASQLDEVRFIIQDTDQSDWFLSDCEIQFLIDTNKSSLQSALAACDILIAKFARLTDEQTGKQTIYGSQLQQQYINLQKNLEKNILLKNTNVFFGGMDIPREFDDREGDNRRAWREIKN